MQCVTYLFMLDSGNNVEDSAVVGNPFLIGNLYLALHVKVFSKPIIYYKSTMANQLACGAQGKSYMV